MSKNEPQEIVHGGLVFSSQLYFLDSIYGLFQSIGQSKTPVKESIFFDVMLFPESSGEVLGYLHS